MKSNLFFPYRYKLVGWFLLVPSVLAGLVLVFWQPEVDFLEMKVFAIYSSMIFQKDVVLGMVYTNILDEVIGVFCIVGGLLVAFSREKDEDEYMAKIRLESLLVATYINYGILLFCLFFLFDFGFLMVMIVNMVAILLITIARYQWQLYKLRKSLGHEE